MAKDSITFEFSGLAIPPWVVSEYEVVYLPFPKDAQTIAHPLSDDHPFFSLPREAFDETGENLICLIEKRWMGMEKAGTRPLPTLVYTQDGLRPEVFAHIILEDTSPETLCDLMGVSGLIIAPQYESQRRFIDSRFHGSTDDAIPYGALHPLQFKKTKKDADLSDLKQAAADIAIQQVAALGGSDDYHDPFAKLCGGDLFEAVALSEYARRTVCRQEDEDTDNGGIVSYYEVLLTVRALFGAMADLIDFSIADGSMMKLEELVRDRDAKGDVRPIHQTALGLFSSASDTEEQRAHFVANVSSYTVEEGFDFLQRCVMEAKGATWGRAIHRSTQAHEQGAGRIVKVVDPCGVQRRFYQDNASRYLTDRYCEGTFSAAIAAQFLTTLADPAPWKRCDNPECGAYFKHHFTTKGTSNPKATSCSPTCSTRKRNRLYNLEASAIRTACRRYSDIRDALEYIENRLAFEVDEKALPRARNRWEKKCRTVLSDLP